MEESDLTRLERANPIMQVAIELGITVKGSVGICFKQHLHVEDEGKPTLFFDAAGNCFTCKVCPDVGGSVIDLVCQCRGWDRAQAVEWLVHRADFDRLTQKLYHGKGKKK
ncbi:MAG: hypothetical protein AB1646_09435 [Thermodesulfobacteriota bacterium]